MVEIILNNKTFVRRKNTNNNSNHSHNSFGQGPHQRQASESKEVKAEALSEKSLEDVALALDGQAESNTNFYTCASESKLNESQLLKDDEEDMEAESKVADPIESSSPAAQVQGSATFSSSVASEEIKGGIEEGSASILLIDQTLGILKRSDMTLNNLSRYSSGYSSTRGSCASGAGARRSTPTLYDFVQEDQGNNKKDESRHPSTASSASTTYSNISAYGKNKDMKRPSRSRTSILFETRRRRRQKEENHKKYLEGQDELKIDDDDNDDDEEEEEYGNESINNEKHFQGSEDYSEYTDTATSCSSFNSSYSYSSSYEDESDASYNSDSEREVWTPRRSERRYRKGKIRGRKERQHSSRKFKDHKREEEARDRRKRKERKRREKEALSREKRNRKREKRERYIRDNKRRSGNHSKRSHTLENNSRRPRSMDNLTLKCCASSENSYDSPVPSTVGRKKRLVSSAVARPQKQKGERDEESETQKMKNHVSPSSSLQKDPEASSDEDESYILSIWDDFEQEWTAWNKKNNKIHTLLEKAAAVSTENERKSHLSKIKSGKIKFANHLTEKYLCKLLDPMPATSTIRKIRKRIVKRISKIEEDFTKEDEEELHKTHKSENYKDHVEGVEAVEEDERKEPEESKSIEDFNNDKSKSQFSKRTDSLHQGRNNINQNGTTRYKLNKNYLANGSKQNEVERIDMASTIDSRKDVNFLKSTQSRLNYGAKDEESSLTSKNNPSPLKNAIISSNKIKTHEISPVGKDLQQKQISIHMKQPQNSVSNFYFGGNLRVQMASKDDKIDEIVKKHDEKHAAVGSIKEIRQKAREQLEREDKAKLDIQNKRKEEQILLEKEQRTGQLSMRENALLDKLRTERIIQEEKEKEYEREIIGRIRSSDRQIEAEDILSNSEMCSSDDDVQKEAATAPSFINNTSAEAKSNMLSPKASIQKQNKIKPAAALNPLRNSLFKKGTGKLSMARKDHNSNTQENHLMPSSSEQKLKLGPETTVDSPENDEEEHKFQLNQTCVDGNNEHEDLNWVCGVCSKTNIWKECKCIVCGRDKGAGKKKTFYDNYNINRSSLEKDSAKKASISKKNNKVVKQKPTLSNNNDEETKNNDDDLPTIPRVDPNIVITNKLLETGARQEKASEDLTSDIQSLLSNIRSINIDSI